MLPEYICTFNVIYVQTRVRIPAHAHTCVHARCTLTSACAYMPGRMQMSTYTYMQMSIYTCMHMSTYRYMHMSTYTYMHVPTYTHMHMSTYTYMQVSGDLLAPVAPSIWFVGFRYTYRMCSLIECVLLYIWHPLRPAFGL